MNFGFRLARAALLAAACAIFFATHVYVEFTGVRARIVRNPVQPVAGEVRAPALPATLRDLNAPFAVIARIRNEAPTTERFSIDVDGAPVCEPAVAGATTARVDCVLNREWTSRQPHEVVVTGPTAAWRLEYLEFATHFGSSSGVLTFVVLPAVSHLYAKPGWFAVLALWIALTAIVLLPGPRLPRWLVLIHRAVVGAFVAWTFVFFVAPFVSKYTVVVEAQSFAFWLVYLAAPGLYGLLRTPIRALATPNSTAGARLRWASVGLIVLVCFGAVNAREVREVFHGNCSGLLRLSRARVEANPMVADRPDLVRQLVLWDGPGYDAQFMYAMSFDPFLLRYQNQPGVYQRFIDFPPYRYGRIGFSMLTALLSANRPALFPVVMIKSILLSLGVCALMIGGIARASGGSVFWGAAILLVPGFWTSLHVGLPEPIAAAGLMAAYFCVIRERWVTAACFFAVALLVRETGALFLICVASSLLLSGRRRTGVWMLAASMTPLVLWRLYVGSIFHHDFGTLAFWNPPDDFSAPFTGIARLWTEIAKHEFAPTFWEMRRATLDYSILILAGSATAAVLVLRRASAPVVAAAGYAAMAILFNFKNVWVHAENAERLTSDLWLMLVLVSAVHFRCLTRPLRIGLVALWSCAAAYLLFGAIDSAFLRGTLLPMI